MATTKDRLPSAPRRTWFTNLVGAAATLCGGLGSLFSAFALLMAVGKPYANSPADPSGMFLIFILPPGVMVAGMGLLLRRRWARWWMILLMAGLGVVGLKSLSAPGHGSPAAMSGPAADASMRFARIGSIGSIAVSGFVLLGLSSRPVRREFAARGEDAGERRGGRRGCEAEEGSHGAGSVPPPLRPADPPGATPRSARDGSVLPMVLLLLAVAVGALGFAAWGVKEGETRLPLRHGAGRMVSRAEQPALFWTCIALPAVLGTGCAGLAGWLVIGRLRAR